MQSTIYVANIHHKPTNAFVAIAASYNLEKAREQGQNHINRSENPDDYVLSVEPVSVWSD